MESIRTEMLHLDHKKIIKKLKTKKVRADQSHTLRFFAIFRKVKKYKEFARVMLYVLNNSLCICLECSKISKILKVWLWSALTFFVFKIFDDFFLWSRCKISVRIDSTTLEVTKMHLERITRDMLHPARFAAQFLHGGATSFRTQLTYTGVHLVDV